MREASRNEAAAGDASTRTGALLELSAITAATTMPSALAVTTATSRPCGRERLGAAGPTGARVGGSEGVPSATTSPASSSSSGAGSTRTLIGADAHRDRTRLLWLWPLYSGHAGCDGASARTRKRRPAVLKR